ncbi:MAG TPA: hypothetical protein VIZ18_15735 [Ktedonobacteraceae bacterium]
MDNTHEQLEQISQLSRTQAKQWFQYSIWAAVFGFVLIIAAVIVALITANVGLGFLSSLAGLLTEGASVLFFQQSKEANKRLDDFYKEILDEARINQAIELALSATSERQNNYVEQIIKKLLG